MSTNVVRDSLNAIFRAITDLIAVEDRDINLSFGFCNVIMRNKNLSVPFADYLTKECDAPEFEGTMKRMNSPVSTLWKTNTSSMFSKSNLGTMIKKPNNAVTEAQMLKTEALRLMSKDFSSSSGFKKLVVNRKGATVMK